MTSRSSVHARTRSPSSAVLLGLGLLLAAGCGSDSPNSTGTGGAGGGTGGAGRGGAGGGSGGSSGSGGSAGTGGAPGAGGSGGNAGSGGAPGAGGSGGTGSGGAGGGPSDGGGGDMSSPDGAGGDANAYLNECFSGLRDRVGDHQTSTKASADGSIRLRLALETADRFGTSGTKGWGVIRFGLVAGATRICIKDEAMLATVYKGSRHNCTDSIVVTVDGILYRIQAPDTHPDRSEATLGAVRGDVVIIAPTKLTTVSCTARAAMCSSGQPC